MNSKWKFEQNLIVREPLTNNEHNVNKFAMVCEGKIKILTWNILIPVPLEICTFTAQVYYWSMMCYEDFEKKAT